MKNIVIHVHGGCVTDVECPENITYEIRDHDDCDADPKNACSDCDSSKYEGNRKELREIWEKLGDIPVNDNGEIEENFMNFSKGTNIEHIWKWIEDKYNVSVYSLLYEDHLQESEENS